MPRINLLPWREDLRKERQREFGVAAGVTAVLAIISVGGVLLQVNGLITHQENRNTFLRNEISLVEKRIEEIKALQETKQQLLNRTAVIEQLQQSRPDIVHLFDELVRTLPPGVFLTSVTQKGTALEIDGVSDAPGSVSLYLRNIESSDYMAEPRLAFIENKTRGREKRHEFKVRARLTPPGRTTGAENGGAAP